MLVVRIFLSFDILDLSDTEENYVNSFLLDVLTECGINEKLRVFCLTLRNTVIAYGVFIWL